MNVNRLWSKLKDKRLEELIRGALGFLNIKILGVAVNLVFIYIVARMYGAAGVGVFSISFVVLKIAELFGKMGLDNALLRFIAAYSANNRNDLANRVYWDAIKISIVSSLCVSAILFFSAPLLARHIFHNPALSASFRIISIIILPSALSELNASYLRGLKYIKSYSFLLNVSTLLFACIVLVAGKPFLEQMNAPVIAYALAAVATLAASFIFVASISKGVRSCIATFHRIQSKTDREIGKYCNTRPDPLELIKVSLPMLLTGSYMLILSWTGTFALGVFCAETEVGIYSVVLRISSVIIFTLTSINSIAASKFSELYSTGDMDGFRKVVLYTSRLVFWTTVPAGLIFLLFPTKIAGIFGKEITGGVTALIILILGYFVNAMCGSVGVILNMTGHQMIYQKIVLCSAALNILLNIMLIPILGINGAAIANSASMILWNVASAVYIKKNLNISTFYIPTIH